MSKVRARRAREYVRVPMARVCGLVGALGRNGRPGDACKRPVLVWAGEGGQCGPVDCGSVAAGMMTAEFRMWPLRVGPRDVLV